MVLHLCRMHVGEYSVHAYCSGKNLRVREEHLTIQLLWATFGLLATRFIVLFTQWMKEIRTLGRSEISSYCFFVWCESSSLLRLKTVLCIVSAKITELGGRLKFQQGCTS